MRSRGLMDDSVINSSLRWVETLERVDALALHNFGEPLLHPDFDKHALAFSKLTPITMSTNGVLLDEKWADRLAKVPWAWISVSPWKKDAQERAVRLLHERGIVTAEPPGAIHNWAGQSQGAKLGKIFKCEFLDQGKIVIRWNGDVVSCCITDRAEDVIGNVKDEPPAMHPRPYSLCDSCHHAL